MLREFYQMVSVAHSLVVEKNTRTRSNLNDISTHDLQARQTMENLLDFLGTSPISAVFQGTSLEWKPHPCGKSTDLRAFAESASPVTNVQQVTHVPVLNMECDVRDVSQIGKV